MLPCRRKLGASGGRKSLDFFLTKRTSHLARGGCPESLVLPNFGPSWALWAAQSCRLRSPNGNFQGTIRPLLRGKKGRNAGQNGPFWRPAEQQLEVEICLIRSLSAFSANAPKLAYLRAADRLLTAEPLLSDFRRAFFRKLGAFSAARQGLLRRHFPASAQRPQSLFFGKNKNRSINFGARVACLGEFSYICTIIEKKSRQ